MKYTVYRVSDGMITRYGSCPDYDVFAQAEDAEVVYQGESLRDDLWYFKYGKPVARPVIAIPTEHTIAADGDDAAEFPLPAGSLVQCLSTGEEWPDEDEFHFSSEVTGTTVFRIYPAFPYQGEFKVVVHAN